jgi:hypothetical protein
MCALHVLAEINRHQLQYTSCQVMSGYEAVYPHCVPSVITLRFVPPPVSAFVAESRLDRSNALFTVTEDIYTITTIYIVHFCFHNSCCLFMRTALPT